MLSETQHQPEQLMLTRLYCYEQGGYAPLTRIDTIGDDLNSPQVYYFHTDALGTPKEVTNSAGQTVWQAD